MSNAPRIYPRFLIWGAFACAGLGIALLAYGTFFGVRAHIKAKPTNWTAVGAAVRALNAELDLGRGGSKIRQEIRTPLKEVRAAAERAKEIDPLMLERVTELSNKIDTLLALPENPARVRGQVALVEEAVETLDAVQRRASRLARSQSEGNIVLPLPEWTLTISYIGLAAMTVMPIAYIITLRRWKRREKELMLSFDGRTADLQQRSRTREEQHRRDLEANRVLLSEAEGQLRMLSNIIANSAMILWAVDRRGIYTFRDGHGLIDLGVSSGDGVGKHFTAVVTGAPGSVEEMQRALAGETFTCEHRADAHWYVTRYSPLRNGEGSVTGVCGITTDVTARKFAEQRSMQEEGIRQAARLKTEFMANMSHELRTPLNGIVGMVGLLGDTRLSDEQQGMLDVIQSSTDNLLRTVNDIIDLTKLEAGKVGLANVEFRMDEVAYDVLRVQAAVAGRKGVELIADFGAESRHKVRGDPERLRQMLACIVDNAIKFTRKGHILLQLRGTVEDGKLQVQCSVADTGAGIEASRLQELLKPHSGKASVVTRKVGDVGFGLPIVKLLVELMGGTFSISSTVDKGTTVELYFPLEWAGEKIPDVEQVLIGRRVLVADDCEVARGIVALKLAAVGARVDVVANGHDAIASCIESIEKEDFYDIVVVDQVMPILDGPAFASMLRGKVGLGSLPMILLSTTSEELEPAKKAQFAGSLEKPVNTDTLVSLIRSTLQPSSSKPLPLAPAATELANTLPASLRILIADDNRVNLLVCRKMLERLGHGVDSVEDGLRLVESIKAGAYDIIFTDCQMPGMDGYEATRAIRAAAEPWSDIWIVAVTANATVADRQSCMAAGMNDFIAKPLRPAALEMAIATFRNARSAMMAPPTS